jgi:hypothetical protein
MSKRKSTKVQITIYKKNSKNNAPSYLCDCLLPFERNENACNLRNQIDYSNPFTRLQLYRNSFFPFTHPQTQPGSLIKFTLKRSAFKLLDLCLSLVCRTFNTLQPMIAYLRNKMHKYSNQCSCTSNKRNVLPHSDHTSYIEFNYFLLWTFSPLLNYLHEYDNSVLL